MKKYILPLLLATLSACKDDFVVDTSASDLAAADAYFLVANDAPATRTVFAVDTIDRTYFAPGDRVGLFALDAEGRPDAAATKQNAEYEAGDVSEFTDPDGAHWQALRPCSPQDRLPEDCAQYIVYYPYRPGLTTVDELRRLTHDVRPDQRQAERTEGSYNPFVPKNRAFEASDLLWDVATPDKARHKVMITMDHAMAQLIVVVDDAHFRFEEGIDIIAQPTRAEGVNLTADGIREMYERRPYASGGDVADIRMWDFDYTNKGERHFRAVVPACRTLLPGTKILRATNRQGERVALALKDTVRLKPGRNYLFDLNRKPTPRPDIKDDDSWVLDVLDPETGEPVGLLCREYIRYQPTTVLRDDDGNWEADQITHPTEAHIGYINPSNKGTVAYDLGPTSVSSQGWVFYNLKTLATGERIPDLSHGQVLRYIYDIRAAIGGGEGIKGKSCVGALPYPHYNNGGHANSPEGFSGHGQGLFLADHGHDWINDDQSSPKTGRSTTESWYDEIAQGTDREAQYRSYWQMDKKRPQNVDHDYFYEFWQDGGMHGDYIGWDGANNRICSYKPYGHRVSNRDAYVNGHISIPPKGEPYVSFTEVDSIYDTETTTVNGRRVRHKAGVVVPRYLIDTRRQDNRYYQYRYPLVKIGFNQFWMSKNLYATSGVHGERLTLNNPVDSLGHATGWPQTKYQTGTPDPMGYCYALYPSGSDKPVSYNPQVLFGEDGCRDIGMGLLYNPECLESGALTPTSRLPHFHYTAPTTDNFSALLRYLGWMSGPKLMGAEYRSEADNPLMPINDALKRGYYLMDTGNHSANISGFNLRADGIKLMTSTYGVGDEAGLMLLPANTAEAERVPVFQIASFGCWHTYKAYNTVSQSEDRDVRRDTERTWHYAPVRFFAQYDNQDTQPYQVRQPARLPARHGEEPRTERVGLELK